MRAAMWCWSAAVWRAWPALLLVAPAHALDPRKAPTQYAHRSWQAQDGLPQNSVQAIAQTRDGYVWFGTQEGLVRFDGVAFTVFNRGNTPALKSNYVYALRESRDGALWIGTNGGGLTRMKDGAFTTYTTKDGLTDDAVISIREDAAGVLWVGTGRGVTVLQAGVFRAFAADDTLVRARVMAVLPDRDGGVWFGTHGHGAGRWHAGSFTRLTTREGLSSDAVWSVYQDRGGAVWIGTVGGGLNRLEAGRLRRFTAKDGLAADSVFGTLEDRDGNLWLATDGNGLVRYANGRFSSFTQAQGLSNDTAWPLLEDRDGTLWVGTLAGVNQLRDAAFTPVGTPEGLRDDVVLTVSEDRAGAVWIGSNGRGLGRLAEGRLALYSKAGGLPHDSIRAVYPDRRGNVWIGTIGGLSRFTGGRFTNFFQRDGLSSDKISALYEDAQGVIWVGTFGGGLNRLDAGCGPNGGHGPHGGHGPPYGVGVGRAVRAVRAAGCRITSFTTKDGLAHDRVLAITGRRAGGLWLATDGGGLSAFDGARFTNYTTKDGLGDDHVEALHEDADGTLWIGTGGGGLSRLRDGRFHTFTTRDGLFDDLAHQILEDDQGRLWISTNRGIYSVSKRELDEVAAGRLAAVHSTVFGANDGMRSAECNGASQPAGWRGADGRLWFPTMAGAVVVDPARAFAEPPAPPVVIEKAVIDGREVAAQDEQLAPGAGAFEFRYTALEYRRPDQLRFRYRLEGFDADWVEAGARRSAYYTNIPPGSYRFVVTAATADGPWAAPAAGFAFHLQPRFHQTAWFRSLAALALLALLAGGHYLRSHGLHRRARELTTLVAERERAHAEVRRLNADLEQRVAERTAELESANRDMQAFSYSISHDLKAPLRGINGFCEALLEEDAGKLDEQGRARLNRVAAAAKLMTQLVDDLLKLSRVSNAPVQIRPVDVTALARSIVGELREREPERVVECSVADGLVASADAPLLRVALTNLIGNAWKYTSKTPHARIEVGSAPQPDGSAACFVSDNGAGFEMEYAHKLFTPFQRLHGASEFPGSGIGLAIVKRVIGKHGGRVWAEGRPGAGATFFFALPQAGAL